MSTISIGFKLLCKQTKKHFIIKKMHSFFICVMERKKRVSIWIKFWSIWTFKFLAKKNYFIIHFGKKIIVVLLLFAVILVPEVKSRKRIGIRMTMPEPKNVCGTACTFNKFIIPRKVYNTIQCTVFTRMIYIRNVPVSICKDVYLYPVNMPEDLIWIINYLVGDRSTRWFLLLLFHLN